MQAGAAAGLFYAAQSFRQLLPAELEKAGPFKSIELPLIFVEDTPRFEHRSFMLDVSRHLFAVEVIKNILDLMALQKLNRFHWHLTDDQG